MEPELQKAKKHLKNQKYGTPAREAAQQKVWELEAHIQDHFDFCIHDTIDVALLFVPESSAKRFHRDWQSQDATNMLNVIETFQLDMPSVTFTREDESGKTKEVHMGDESIVDVCA